MMAREKRIYTLIIKVNKVVFLFLVAVFTKRNRNHVVRVSIEFVFYFLSTVVYCKMNYYHLKIYLSKRRCNQKTQNTAFVQDLSGNSCIY